MSVAVPVRRDEHDDSTSSCAGDAKAKASPLLVPPRANAHPLQNCWTLWFFRNDRSRPWEENQRAVISVKTVEDFWAVVNHIEGASRLQVGCDYSLFKEGIKPMWEDDLNSKGGRYNSQTDSTFSHKNRKLYLTDCWGSTKM